ncbi:MAG: DUF1566 domain-containing protein [candidate division KSB1 bacterium]|nr:DUF1566 domain-containing protein [candidate division KSB1 bacterium]
MNWQEALVWVKDKNAENYLGYSDWRLPNAKELQSIVDYERSSSEPSSPAISLLFSVPVIEDEEGNKDYPFYWTSTTHVENQGGNKAVYISFGRVLGFMEMLAGSGNYTLTDVHGAGAQRSDPKQGDPAEYPYGHGPQGDVIRIYNYVRPVRNISSTATDVDQSAIPTGFRLYQNVPNPFNPVTTLAFNLDQSGQTRLTIYNLIGQEIEILVDARLPAGVHRYRWDAGNQPAGMCFCRLSFASQQQVRRMLLVK